MMLLNLLQSPEAPAVRERQWGYRNTQAIIIHNNI